MQTYTDHETGNTITILTDTLKTTVSSIRQIRCGHMTENIYYSGHPAVGNGEKIERTLPNGEKRS